MPLKNFETVAEKLWIIPNSLFDCSSFKLSAMFKLINVELEPISNVGMYLLFEKGKIGAVFHISKRYSKASNQYLKFYYPKQESKQIIYLWLIICVVM